MLECWVNRWEVPGVCRVGSKSCWEQVKASRTTVNLQGKMSSQPAALTPAKLAKAALKSQVPALLPRCGSA